MSSGKRVQRSKKAATQKRSSTKDIARGAAAKPSRKTRRRRPYVRRLEGRRGVEVWLVDGSYIRKNVDEEFSNFGHHGSFQEIPKNEIWIDVEADPDEHRFFVAHAALERRLMLGGKDYDSARRQANRMERKLRIGAGDLRKVTA